MKAPIFVWQPNDLLAFSSVEAAEGWVEWQDVDEGTRSSRSVNRVMRACFWTSSSRKLNARSWSNDVERHGNGNRRTAARDVFANEQLEAWVARESNPEPTD